MRVATQLLIAAAIVGAGVGGWFLYGGAPSQGPARGGSGPPAQIAGGPGAAPGGATGGATAGAPAGAPAGRGAPGAPQSANGAGGAPAPVQGARTTPGGGPPGAGPPGGPPGAGGGRGPPQAVIVAVPKRDLVVDLIESVGTARANEAVTVTAKQTGVVSKINFREGQRVTAGVTLVELDASERQADLDNLRAQRDEARTKLARAKQLRNLTMSEARIDELETQVRAAEARLRASEARLDDLRITAPFNGRVGLRQVSLGALVQPGAVITTLDDVAIIKVEFSIPEIALPRLRVGLPVKASTPGVQNRVLEGQVNVVDSRVDPATRSVRVNAQFDNGDDALKPGLFMNVELLLGRRADALLVPEEAIVPEGTRQFLFVVANGRAVRTEVTLGTRVPGFVEVVKGVGAQDQVIIRGVQKVRNGQAVVPRTDGTAS